MGEIADATNEFDAAVFCGDVCANCGKNLDNEEGYDFPRYCSVSCARDAGIIAEEKKQRVDKPFLAIKKASDLQKLESFLQPIRFSYYDDSTPDKIGNCMFKLYHDSKPHKETTRGVKVQAIVVVVNVSMIDRVKEMIEARMGKEG